MLHNEGALKCVSVTDKTCLLPFFAPNAFKIPTFRLNFRLLSAASKKVRYRYRKPFGKGGAA